MTQPFKRTINLYRTFYLLIPFIRPYRVMIFGTLLLTFLGALTAQVNPIVLKYTIDAVERLLKVQNPMAEGWTVLMTISAILLVKEIINIAIHFGQKYYGEKIRINVSATLSETVVGKILSYRMAFYTNPEHEGGKLQTRIDRGIESLTRLVQNIFIDILPLFSNAIIALIIMYAANVYVGLLASIIIPIYFYISNRQAEQLQGVRRKLRRQREVKTNGLLNIIQSITVIKSFVRESYEQDKQLQLQTQLMDSQLETRRSNYWYDAVKTFVEQVGIVLIIILTVYLVLDNQMTIGAIMLHTMLFNNVSAPIRQLHRIYDEMNDAFIYAEGYFDILNADEEREHSGTYTSAAIDGCIMMKAVNFTYPNGAKVLHNINLTLYKGKTTALVGLSGAGKSTIINLLAKFYTPDSGSITLDGTSLEQYDTAFLRQQIGLVLQKNHIFNGTVEENIRYGDLDATAEDVVQAARQAFLHEQIQQLPKGYQTNATHLSGGQQQRIAIARLFLKNPPIIFLDEPTASLDAIATEQIKNSLDAIKANRTVVIVSHSLSQILDADYIYVLKQGAIVEEGVHETLFKKQGVYREIFDATARGLNIERLIETYN